MASCEIPELDGHKNENIMEEDGGFSLSTV